MSFKIKLLKSFTNIHIHNFAPKNTKMEYNAIIYEYTENSLKVIGRQLVTDWNDIPKGYTIKYFFLPVDPQTTKLEELCCGPKNPLYIFKPVQNSFTIFIRNVFGKSLEVDVGQHDTIKVVKQKIFQVTETYHPKQQELFVNRNNKEIKLKNSCSLIDYGICAAGSCIFLKPKLHAFLAGLNYRAIDLDSSYLRVNKMSSPSSPITLSLAPSSQTDNWTKYSAGLNFCGTCPNSNCISKDSGMDVVIKMGFGEIRFIVRESQWICPACNNSLIFPDKYLVSSGRALFHYKRDKEEQKAMTAQLVTSVGSGDQFQEIYLGHPYIIEINTVEPWRSPYSCVGCGAPVLFENHEYVMDCEEKHVYHKWCKPSLFGKCKICKAKCISRANN